MPAALIAAAIAAASEAAVAASVHIAVAANFTDAAKEIGAAFEKASGHKAIFSFGSTGQLYTQITQDAPFEVLLAADQERPRKALAGGLGVQGTVFTYAIGRIVLYSRDKDTVTDETTLRSGQFARIAIANPATAPYGAAAVETMKALAVYDALKPKIVQGANIAQVFQFVSTGNAEIGFVALSQVAGRAGGSRWIVPSHLHSDIAQDAVLLRKGSRNEAARAFLAFLKGPQARAIEEKYGYGPGD